MQQLFPIFIFYRSLILWSFGINILLSYLKYDVIPIVIAKLLLIFFLWFIINETQAKRKLFFYKNMGVSTFKLFFLLFILDLLLSLPFILILEEFI